MADRDRMESARAALRYQRTWFEQLHEHAAGGGLVALVNADTPHEILRAFDIPYVVNQWWASIASSQGGGQRSLDLLTERGYPRDSEQYNSIPLGGVFEDDPTDAPWGGLPKPFLVLGDLTGDVSGKIFEVWGQQPGITFFPLENSAVAEADPGPWWDSIATDWERVVGSERIDLMVGELRELIELLEERTGRAFDEGRLREILALGNEQAEWNRRTRDLAAAAHPFPMRVNDSIPAVMVPQWHRGTEWGRDAAKALHDEVAERVATSHSVVPDERARLMWIGRGLWFDLGFYQHFEEEFGAVFVWSMYLAIAADGYARYGDDPLREVSSRFIGFHEHLYVAPQSVEWYVNEASRHGVDGVVHLVSPDPRGSWAITRGLEAAGIPVYELHADNADSESFDVDAVRASVAQWLQRSVQR